MLAAITVVTLAACGPDAERDIAIKGSLSYNADKAGNAALPEDATARIGLVALDAQKSSKRIVAERSLHDLGQSPIEFELRVGKQLIDSNGQYGIRAAILDAKGRKLWQTDAAKLLDPRAVDTPVKLDLKASEQSSDTQADVHQYRCDGGFQFSAQIKNHGVIVRLGNRRLELDESTTGNAEPSVYADSHGNRLSIGTEDDSNLRIDDSTHERCRKVSEPPTKPL